MSDNNNPNQKRPGEKKPGTKYHYNPGNQSGKTVDIGKPASEQQNNRDRIRSRDEKHG